MKKNSMPKYREDKAIAVVSKLLKLAGGQCDKYWVNKVMYYIERESLIKSGQPMFFDTLYSLKFGPIVSATKDGIDFAEYPTDTSWGTHFRLEGNTIHLVTESDYSELSPFEENIIEKAYENFKGYDFTQLHEYFGKLPENKETTSREPIAYEDILKAEGYKQEEIEETLAELSYLSFLEGALNCAA